MASNDSKDYSDKDTLISLENEFILQTYERAKVVFTHGKGCYLYDSHGKEYVDLVGGIATTSIGHANRKVNDAISSQAKKLISVSNLYYSQPMIILAEKLSKLSGMNAVFFCNSGTEAIEAAIKLARKFTGKKGIIACVNGFHGRTMGALSITYKEKFRKPFEPLVPGMSFVPFNDIQALSNSITDETAAFIVEPIQGESGIIVPFQDYLKEVKSICEKKGILLIVDEIQTNMRTGKFFAYQHEGIIPDIVTVAKGIANGVPIGILLTTSKVREAFKHGDHGSTFGGNALSCAAANAVIDFIVENKLVEKSAENGDYFMKKLNSLRKKHPKIKEVRGKGLMIGVELNVSAKDIVEKCLDKGLVVNKCSEYVLRFLPPLIVGKKEINKAVAILDEVLGL